jgi:hypothetical protein
VGNHGRDDEFAREERKPSLPGLVGSIGLPAVIGAKTVSAFSQEDRFVLGRVGLDVVAEEFSLLRQASCGAPGRQGEADGIEAQFVGLGFVGLVACGGLLRSGECSFRLRSKPSRVRPLAASGRLESVKISGDQCSPFSPGSGAVSKA